MQKTKLLGYGLFAVVTSLASSAALVACTGDDTVTAGAQDGGTGTDAGTTKDTGTTTDSGTTKDTGTGAVDSGKDSSTPPELAKILVVHGAIAAGTVRICFAVTPPGAVVTYKNDIAALPALPNKGINGGPAGLPPGAGGVLPSTGADLSKVQVTPIIFPVGTITTATAASATPNTEYACDELVKGVKPGTTGLMDGKDYFVLPTIAPGTFSYATTVVVVATGCLPNSADGAAYCGDGYDAVKGNLKALAFKLDRTAPAAGKNFVQFIHASQESDGYVMTKQGIMPNLEANPAAGAAIALSPADILFSDKKITAGQEVNAISASATGIYAAFKLGRAPQAFVPVGNWAALSDPAKLQGAPFFVADKGYTFVAVGDPRAPANNTDVKWLHFLVFPNNPVVPAFAP